MCTGSIIFRDIGILGIVGEKKRVVYHPQSFKKTYFNQNHNHFIILTTQ